MDSLGDYAAGSTVNIFFSTSNASGGRVGFLTAIELADFDLYKNTSTTQRTSTAGWTLSETFDSQTGIHAIAIDTSDNTDAGFYAAGNDYTLVLTPDETVDGQTVAAVLGQFSIENRFTRGTDSAALASVCTEGRLAELDAGNLPTDIAAIPTTAMRGTDSAALASVCTEARLAELAAANLPADVAAVKAETALIVADTNELQTDDVPGLIAALNDLSAAAVNAEVDTALSDVNLDHLVGTATAIPAVPAGTYIDQIMDDGTAAYDRTTDSLQALRDTEPHGTAMRGTDSAGTAANLATVDTVVDAIKAVTDLLPNAGALSDLAAILTDTAQIGAAGAGLTDLGGMSTGMKAEVNTEVADVVKTDTLAEVSQGAPPVLASLETKIAYLYTAWRNKITQTSSLQTMFADNGTTALTKATVSDDGTTATKDEVITGA